MVAGAGETWTATVTIGGGAESMSRVGILSSGTAWPMDPSMAVPSFFMPQGVAAAMMMPVGRMAIIRTFPKSELLRAMNFVIIPALLGPLLGPTVGGLIVHWANWRVMFFVNVPVGLLALWLGYRVMPNYRSDDPGPLDLRGLLLFGLGAGLLSWLLEIFGDHALALAPAQANPRPV